MNIPPDMPEPDLQSQWGTVYSEQLALLHHEAWRLYAATLEAERDALKLQAQIWKQEANTHKASLHECYQAATGSTGEPGNWNGAEPVKQRIGSLEAELVKCREALRLAANRLDRSALDCIAGTREAYERVEWANEARAAFSQVEEPALELPGMWEPADLSGGETDNPLLARSPLHQ